MRLRILLAAVLLAILAGFFACKSHKPAAAAAERRFPIEGRVVAADADARTLTLDHHDIPGYMKGMIMAFPVHDTDGWVFGVVHRGDTVQATLVVGDDAWLEDISITESPKVAELSSTSPVHLPQKGDAVPDFHFVNQDGQPIHLAQYRGQPLLVTFIYSRCPLPDYCPRMSNNFAAIAKILQQYNRRAFNKLQMLSITLDPEFDDPGVLRGYGKGYAGAVDPGLKHWSFATGSPDEIRQAAEFFGLSYEKQSGQVIHNLRTTLIDANGRVFELYSGNQWQPSELASEIQQLQR